VRIILTKSIAALFAIALHLYLSIVSSAQADDMEGKPEVVDVSLITCGEFGRMPLPRALVLVGWIGGFYAGRNGDTKVEVHTFVDAAERVIAVCREHESMRLMVAVDEEVRRLAAPSDGTPAAAPNR
jgi:hypothetical protein